MALHCKKMLMKNPTKRMQVHVQRIFAMALKGQT